MNCKLVIITVVGILLIGITAISIVVVASSKHKDQEGNVCLTDGCYRAASRIKTNLDPQVKPCDNFYDFACGGYLASTRVPRDEINVSPASSLAKEIKNQLKTILEEPGSPGEPKHFQLARNLYRTCMNTTAIEEVGLKPVLKVLNEIGKWPVLEGDDWNEGDFDWVQSVYKARKLGYVTEQFFTSGINVDWNDNKKYLLMWDQPSFDLSQNVRAYYDYMVDISVLLGTDRERATWELRESLEFEINLANVCLTDRERRNFTLLNNQMTLAELTRRYPIVNWLEYFNDFLPSTLRVDANEVVMVMDTNFIRELESLIITTPKRVQANYFAWRIVADSVKYLSESVRKRRMKYMSAEVRNVVENSDPRWKQCLDIISESWLS